MSDALLLENVTRTFAQAAGTLEIFRGVDLDLVPVEAVVLVEAGVLGGDHRVLQVGRDLSEWNELVAFAIGRAVNQRL